MYMGSYRFKDLSTLRMLDYFFFYYFWSPGASCSGIVSSFKIVAFLDKIGKNVFSLKIESMVYYYFWTFYTFSIVFSMLGQDSEVFFLFFQKIRFDISCKLSPQETVCLQSQPYFLENIWDRLHELSTLIFKYWQFAACHICPACGKV